MTYCEVADLLLGKIPLPPLVDPQKYVNDATDEIDSHIGLLYVTPIDVSNTSTVPRPVRLLLKRLAVHLATGRLILAITAGAEMQKLHAYGDSLVKSVEMTLKEICDGKISLLGVPLVDEGGNLGSLPMIANEDAESNTSAFYDRIVAGPGVLSDPSVWPYTVVRNGFVNW